MLDELIFDKVLVDLLLSVLWFLLDEFVLICNLFVILEVIFEVCVVNVMFDLIVDYV